MCRFIETICLTDGQPERLPLHNARLNATRRHFFGPLPDLDLRTAIDGRLAPASRVRCRVVYAESIEKIEYFPYRLRPVHTLRLVAADDVDYAYKYASRAALDRVFSLRGVADEVLMVRGGRLTDTSIANIALFDGHEWLTPVHPLLAGTRRADLLQRGLIRPADLRVADLPQFSRIRLFNAMIPFGEVELDCRQIQQY